MSENEMSQKKPVNKSFRVIALIVLLALLGFVGFLVIGEPSDITKPTTHGQRVLIVRVVSKAEDSSGIAAFEKALKQGGEVSITGKEVLAKYPLLEDEYTVSDPTGSYFPRGTIINYVVDRGWNLHSHGDPLNATWFTEK